MGVVIGPSEVEAIIEVVTTVATLVISMGIVVGNESVAVSVETVMSVTAVEVT